ncbi:TlpA family protein disulfide reductase [Tamlana fucoidanivorans]|uniref:TlpA family protein disulfide reductase n=1 Tax=Allotamlana fucoidanivorans TaxID=2583814 RepID=A0A5C4SD93_9FLAO|nr:TlpA disulfide reductase family protein [Tamlana fucoidanivorans]TNJ41200.1 TlpA family protein disulfide reductase [Tamlana fucoidanivorans]
MKRIIYLIFILLIGCSDSKTDFRIKLDSQEGYGTFMPGRVILWPNTDSLIYKNIPKDIDEYVVRSLSLQPSQYYWNKYLDGSIEKEQFENIAKYYRIDTTKLTNETVDCEVLFLIGTKSNKRIIIIDTDNDEDFGNEKILEYEYPLTNEKQKEIESTLPIVTVHFDYFENSQLITKETKVKPSPYKGSLGLTFNTDNEIEKKYFLFASFPEHKEGHVDFNGVDYIICVSNGFSRVNYATNRLSVFITPQSDSLSSELNGDIPYEIGDVFNVKGHDYLIDSVTNWGDEIFIKYLGENTKPVGITEGHYMPKFEAKHLDNSVFELKQHHDKYILLDFWGTWCNPCIKLIPELKKINSEYSNDKFVLVSVAYDSDPKKVTDFISRENMNWEHLFVNQNQEDKNSLIEKLKISSYPSTILIAPDGKIIARNKTMNELEEILKNAL